ncbi:hypothetical protein [Sinorhizobium meliloti]|uniref:hypothetical protein n=1 Tax=Rhizobium meliloti TaxID=382 RepID=UPI000FD95E42|nr:hypothetical protein [Sinorhizobium meliloti]RVL38020.1 hypothetical protein CN148_11940 [Sinorhizobium meliloti]
MTDRPAIKPLEWKEIDLRAGSPPLVAWEAKTPFVTYTLESIMGRPWFCHFICAHFSDLDEAKAAIQSHHEKSIRSCLLDKPEAVEGVRDALETAKTQIIAAYRVWVADDVAAFPTPMSQAGEAISKIDRALSSLKGDRA